MARTADDHFEEIFRLLKQQRDRLARGPSCDERIRGDKELSFRMRQLVDSFGVSDFAPESND